MAKTKRADQIRKLYNLSRNWTREQWELINQKGFEFSNDNQQTKEELDSLREQGMPDFTINRILPVVEMLNFYATANNPRWQAIGVEGSDSDVAAVLSDLTDYIWDLSNGSVLYSNAVNDAITKSLGYIMVTVDSDLDNGMGEVVLKQPEPFDIYVDPKSRDALFKDASYILIRKVLPKHHLISVFPDMKAKINKASSDEQSSLSMSLRETGTSDQDLFTYNDQSQESMGITPKGEDKELVEFFEMYEKIKVSYINLFYRIPPNEEQLKQIQQQAQVQVQEMAAELQVQMLEQQQQMEQAVQSGKMLPERYELEMKKAQEMMQNQIQTYQQEVMSQLQSAASQTGNQVISEKEFKIMQKDDVFAQHIVEAIPFYGTRVKQTCVAGDQLLYEKVLPQMITEYPIVPITFKWTGTPFPKSAVSPLIGKQRELNKAHQLMVHNASLGSSLRWMYEEGSVDAELWEKYSSAPGALLPVRPGSERPTPVMPMPISNAFFQICNEGKHDMEYLAGIYASMQGDTSAQHETYRGMLALDEYGTRRIKQWMKSAVEPALKQLGTVIMQFAQAVYSANKRFRIIQPSALQEQKESEINVPIYNDMGEAIGKSMDISALKFDVRVVAGSTLPVNRWAYLDELKQLMQMGIVDDIAVLAETDIKNKDKIAQRKSLYAQLQGQIGQLSEAMKDKDGTIETLQRQLVQAGIKGKVMQAEMEITKQKEQVKGGLKKQFVETEGKQKLLRNVLANEAESKKKEMALASEMFKKDLQGNNES